MWRVEINNFLYSFLAGGASTGLIQLFQTPVDLMNLIIYSQNQNQPIPFVQRLFCYLQLLQEDGIITYLCKNGFQKIMRSALLSGVHFSVKDTLKSLFLSDHEVTKNTRKLFFGTLINGGISGIIGLLTVYFLDFQMIMQMNNAGPQSNRNSTRSNQIKQVFIGLGLSLPGVFVYRAFYFGCYDAGKQILWGKAVKQRKASFLFKFFLAYISTFIASSFSYPFDTIRRRIMMQQNTSGPRKIGIFGVIKQIIQKEGLSGFFKGNSITIGRYVNQSLALVLYDCFQKIILRI
ncbi:unnamed protein product [Paramecium pentaurelia]|uniref:ADP/ATP translocase n=1 Tax=Paramecium pentaurelia TaxID=43138 RepID=A0A8S1SJA2_9CILI|nr:unnamed protein product [Paramecium pentaurelia]